MTDRSSGPDLEPRPNLLAGLNVGKKISLGFITALGIAFAGTVAGIWVGEHYERQARKSLATTLAKSKLVFKTKAAIHHASIFQRDMVYLLDKPEALAEKISRFQSEVDVVERDFVDLQAAFEQTKKRSPTQSKTYSKVEQAYEEVALAYFRNVEFLLKEIESLEITSNADDREIAQTLLLDAGTDSSFMGGHMFANVLQELADELEVETFASVNQLETTAHLRRNIILVSLTISGVIAGVLIYLISRSIIRPLQAVEKVAQQVTKEDRFDLQVPVTSDDEVATVAHSLNQLIERVRSLLAEQSDKAQALESINTELVSTQQQMIAQEKLASLGSLTAGIAHEIKNPLNFVNNFAEISVELVSDLVEDVEAQKEQLDAEFYDETTEILDSLRTLVGKIDHHGKRADSIVANMLQHSRSGESEWKSVDINELIKESINLAYHGMRAKQSDFNLEFDHDYDESIGLIQASPQNLNRVFLNIASNACYAIYQKQLSEGDDFKPLLKLRTRQQNGHIEVHIRDNGPGMTPEIKAKVFEQFFTTKPTGEGTGLGLSLSYNIVVEQHQGTMTVESEPNIYTDFIVTLPILNYHE